MTTDAGRHDPAVKTGSGDIPADTFAARLVLARMHVGLTIQDAAARCGLLNQSWSNWERGRVPRDLLDVVEAISEGLGIDRDWLLFGGPLAKPDRPRRDLSARRQAGLSAIMQDRTADPADPPVPPVTTPQRPRDNRPSGRPAHTAPPPASRRPRRLSRPARV